MIQTLADVTVQCLGPLDCGTGLPEVQADNANVQTFLQLTFGFIGAAAVIVIIIAGLQLVSAQGNPEDAAKARRTLVFAALGLAVALSAEIIVTFVLTGF